VALLTTEEAVQRIIQYDTSVIPDIEPFIADASLIVEAVIGLDSLSAAQLELVARYATAHLMAVTDVRVSMEQVKSLMVRYNQHLDKGLGITTYGTTAMLLDTTGKLAAWNNRVITGGGMKQFFWAGEAS
jgi:hypothetical protein